ncbi:MAG: MgtC/SapB family protein [Prevotella sp.]|nr:MgtC/SapB family protein [Prevotella sp.]
MYMDFILRILIAALLGGLIGLEREYRAKEAGFRTHFLVALGSALFMIVSAHGFADALLSPEHRLDVSRIAAQVVSGIGFIGAGTIIFQRHAVRGLTTAAGLWVTAAIGLASGAGMYVIASFATVLVLLCLEALNYMFRRMGHHYATVSFVAPDADAVQRVVDRLTAENIKIDTYQMKKNNDTVSDEDQQAHPLYVTLEIKVSNSHSSVSHLLSLFDGVMLESIE